MYHNISIVLPASSIKHTNSIELAKINIKYVSAHLDESSFTLLYKFVSLAIIIEL